MPFYLKESDVLPQVSGLQSVLIVPCRFCPAASSAVREKKPYIQLFRRFLRTESYESLIRRLKRRLEDAGIRTAVFESRYPHQFAACMWSSKRRKALGKRAKQFEGVVVLGCDATVELVRDSLGAADCRVVKGMENEGLMNVLPTLKFPFSISLELKGITPVITKAPRNRKITAELSNVCEKPNAPVEVSGKRFAEAMVNTSEADEASV